MITSTRNPRVQAAAKLHRRRTRAATGHTLVEGPGAVGVAIAAGVTVVDAFYRADDDESRELLGERAVAVSAEVLARIAATDHPRGPVAVIETPPAAPVVGDVVVLVGVGDPGNAGTIVRSAAAFGFGVVATPGTVDVWSPKVLRAGAGSHFQTAITVSDDGWLSSVRTDGRRIAALVVEGGVPVETMAGGAIALLVGEEAAGLSHDLVESADVALTVEMPGPTESLNAAVAASLAMYVRSRTR